MEYPRDGSADTFISSDNCARLCYHCKDTRILGVPASFRRLPRRLRSAVLVPSAAATYQNLALCLLEANNKWSNSYDYLVVSADMYTCPSVIKTIWKSGQETNSALSADRQSSLRKAVVEALTTEIWHDSPQSPT